MTDNIEMVGRAELIKVGDIPEAIANMLSKYRNIVSEINIILPEMKNEKIKKFLEKKYDDSRNIITALESGFVPVLVESPVSLKPKTSIARTELKELMDTLPPEAEAALGRAKELGLFDEFAISGGPRGGDPVIVGVIRNKFFLIAAWVNVDGGGAIGYTFRSM